MYPYHRLVKMVLRNMFRKQEVFDIDKEYLYHFRPGIGDIDLYPEVNNGRHLVFCDLARYDAAFRIGLFKYVRKNKYAFVIGGSTMRYRKRLAPFRKATVRSKIVGMDEKFYYFQQTIEQKGEVKSSALVRAGIRFKGGSALPRETMKNLGYDIEPFMEPWVVEWAKWDNETRPWPEPISYSVNRLP